MGKSPGKWIKTVLFGKKSSKSNLSKNVAIEKRVAAKAPAGNLAGDLPVITDPPSAVTDRGGGNLELEKGINTGTPCETVASLPANQVVESELISGPNTGGDPEIRRLDEAATKAQAAFRGYLARRAFRALKGIIRLQALIRGHLVRRQAVATLHCMQAIVKFQALARGRRIRVSDPRFEVLTKCGVGNFQVDASRTNSSFRSEKLANNVFVRKLLASVPNAKPLSLQYDLAEPNSAWNWLDRWSLSRFWEPPVRKKKVVNVKSQRRQSSSLLETEGGKPKRNIRKVPNAANVDTNASAPLDLEKPKRNTKKVLSNQTGVIQEQPQSELERVKRNLRKVSASLAVSSDKSGVETEKACQIVEKVPNTVVSDTPDKEIVAPEEPIESTILVDKPPETDAPIEALRVDEAVDVQNDAQPAVEPPSVENDERVEISTAVHSELSHKEEHLSKENLKTRRRRSLPVKQEYPENVSQNTPTLPSYMAATESAKAKLRAQGSSMLVEDGAENGFVRRHSLPASNGKLNSLSPRVMKPVQANGKGGMKTNKSLTSSRDDRALQPGWRR